MEKNYNLLNQFVGFECEISFRSLIGNIISATYIYQSFSYNIDDGFIYLQDESNNDCNTYIQLEKIIEVKNLCDDLYKDVVSIYYGDYIIDVGIIEKPFVYPKCHKCGKEIHIPEESNWGVFGREGYENPYDGDMDVVRSLEFCSECMVGFIGEVDSLVN